MSRPTLEQYLRAAIAERTRYRDRYIKTARRLSERGDHDGAQSEYSHAMGQDAAIQAMQAVAAYALGSDEFWKDGTADIRPIPSEADQATRFEHEGSDQ